MTGTTSKKEDTHSCLLFSYELVVVVEGAVFPRILQLSSGSVMYLWNTRYSNTGTDFFKSPAINLFFLSNTPML